MANLNQKNYDAEKDFPNLTQSKAFLKDCLTPDLYKQLRDVTTSSGFTLDRAIQSCVDLPKSEKIGIVAGDEDTYTVFADVMDKIIERRHGVKRSECKNKTDLDPYKITGSEVDQDYVLSTRVRTSRSINDFALPPHCCRAERREVERIISDALSTISGGEYHSLETMDDNLRDSLVNNHYLFKTPTFGFHLSAGVARDWPDARGIWYNKDKTLLFWVNEEDHLRVISMQSGGNVKAVFARFCNALNQVERMIEKAGHKFMRMDDLGYISTCPSNIGTGLRASVHIRLPLLTKHPKFDEITKKLHLECRGTDGEESSVKGGIHDISNSRRINKSEVELVQGLIDSVHLLTKMEKELENGKDIDDLLPM